MPAAWEADREESWSDRDEWRGDVHQDDVESWRGGAVEEDPAWAEAEPELTVEDADEDWPENLAGPEYWLFKRDGM